MKTVNLQPEWPGAVRLHFFVLRNIRPELRDKQLDDTEAEMLRLATAYEKAIKLIEDMQAQMLPKKMRKESVLDTENWQAKSSS